jgi:hypothetical protein
LQFDGRASHDFDEEIELHAHKASKSGCDWEDEGDEILEVPRHEKRALWLGDAVEDSKRGLFIAYGVWPIGLFIAHRRTTTKIPFSRKERGDIPCSKLPVYNP